MAISSLYESVPSGTAKVRTLPSRVGEIREPPVVFQIRVLVESSGSVTKRPRSMASVSPGANVVSGRALSTGDWLTRSTVRRKESVLCPPLGSVAVKVRLRAPEKAAPGVSRAVPSVICMATNESAWAVQDSSALEWSVSLVAADRSTDKVSPCKIIASSRDNTGRSLTGLMVTCSVSRAKS